MSASAPTRAVILVAGLGSRLKPMTDAVPKCLTEVHGTPILANALDTMSGAGIREVALVVGHLGRAVRSFAGGSWQGMPIHYVENPMYNQTNTAYSLFLALAGMGEPVGPVLILEGDVFFERAVLENLFAHPGPDKTVVSSYQPPLDGSFVDVDAVGTVRDWWHKSQQPPDFVRETRFKTVNIHLFSPGFVATRLVPALSRELALSHDRAPLEYVMKSLVKKGAAIAAVRADGLKWWEIDDPADLEQAERIFRPEERA